MTRWLKQGKDTGGDIQKAIYDCMGKKPYSILAIFVVLGDKDQQCMPWGDVKGFIDKSHLDISATDYGQF